MKIAIVGSGAVGGYFGGLLAKAGEDVTFVARGAHAQTMKSIGLTIHGTTGSFTIPVKVVESAAQLDAPELVIFTVKTYDTDEVAAQLAKVITDHTIVITFQNGVENDLLISARLQKGKVFPGICYVISTKTHSGVIEQTGGLKKLIIGDRSKPADSRLKEVGKIMTDAGIDVVLSDDIVQDLWSKFIFIIAFGGMTALTRKPIGEVLSNSETFEQYEEIVREGVAVAEAMDVNLPDHIFDHVLKTAYDTIPTSKSSLLKDIERGAKNEIETLNGTVVKYAKQVGISVPMNEKIYNEFKAV